MKGNCQLTMVTASSYDLGYSKLSLIFQTGTQILFKILIEQLELVSQLFVCLFFFNLI